MDDAAIIAAYQRLARTVISLAVADLARPKLRDDAKRFLEGGDSPWFAMAGIEPERVGELALKVLEKLGCRVA